MTYFVWRDRHNDSTNPQTSQGRDQDETDTFENKFATKAAYIELCMRNLVCLTALSDPIRSSLYL